MGALYQLRSKTEKEIPQDVAVNGPYDKYGYILKEISRNADGILYLIRGTGNAPRGGRKENLPQF